MLKFFGDGGRGVRVVAGGKAVIRINEAVEDDAVGDSVGVSGKETKDDIVGVGINIGCIVSAPPPVTAATSEVTAVMGVASVGEGIAGAAEAPQAG